MDGLDRTIERARGGDRKAAEQLRRIFHAGQSVGPDELRVRQYITGALAATEHGTDPAAALNTVPRPDEASSRGRRVGADLQEELLAASVASWVEDEGASLTDALRWTAEAWSLADASVRTAVERHRPGLLG